MQTFPKVVLQFSKTWPSKSLKSPWISTFGICRNLLLFGNILFWLLSNTITTFITLQQTKINTSRLIHDRQWRYCVKTIIMAICSPLKITSGVRYRKPEYTMLCVQLIKYCLDFPIFTTGWETVNFTFTHIYYQLFLLKHIQKWYMFKTHDIIHSCQM